MKFTKYLICAVILVISAQIIKAKNLDENVIKTRLHETTNALAHAQTRGISDVWSSVKRGAISTWNFVKAVGNYTKEKLKILIGNVIQYGKNLMNKFEQKLMQLRDNVYNTINDIYGTGQLVKECTKKEQETLGRVFRELMSNMGQCIAEEINPLTTLRSNVPEPVMNETMFLEYLNYRKKQCETKAENIQDCYFVVRQEIFDNFTVMEDQLLQNHFQARSLADDIKDTLVTCSISNLIDAAHFVATGIVDIGECVSEAKGQSNEKPSVNKN